MTIKKEIREQVYNKYNGHCAYCGKELEYKDMQVDHIIPSVRGGEDDFDNYMPTCRRCNHYKRANSLEGWRKMIEEIPLKLERDSYIYRVGIDYKFYEKPKRQKVKFYFEYFLDWHVDDCTRCKKYYNDECDCVVRESKICGFEPDLERIK